MKVICISGHAQHGKDTFAKMLEEELELRNQKVLVTHYADLVKYICKQFFGWDGQKDEVGRHLLQYVGTDIVRKQNENYWVDFITDMLKFFDGHWDCVLIPDTRFPNEIDRLKDAGFDVESVRIIRINFENTLTPEQRNHPSETSLDDYFFKHYIINKSLESMQKDAVKLADKLTGCT